MLAAVAAGVATLVERVDRAFWGWGDGALIELSVRDAVHLRQQLGVYSRFGWHHPGPTWFYLAAPFQALPGDTARALFVAGLVVSGLAAVAIVWVVRRWASEPAARWAAAVVGVHLALLGADRLTDPWNPFVIVVPTALAVVLAAAAGAGSRPALVGSVAVASLVVQGHVATGPAMVAALVVGAALHLRRSLADQVETGLRPMVLVAAGLLVVGVMWAPPFAEEIDHNPGNLSEIADYTGEADEKFGLDDPSFGDVVDAVLVETAVVDGPEGVRAAVVIATFVGALVVAVACRRRSPFASALGAASVAGLLAAVAGATRTEGELELYLVAYTAGLTLAAWVAIAVGVTTFAGEAPRVAVAAAVAAVAGSLAFALVHVRSDLSAYPESPDVLNAVALVRTELGADPEVRRHGLVVDITTNDRYPIAAGVVADLDEGGWRVHVPEPEPGRYGERRAETGREPVTIVLAPAGDPRPPDVDRLLGRAVETDVWIASRP